MSKKLNKDFIRELTNDKLFILSEDLDGPFLTTNIEIALIEIYGESNYALKLCLSDEIRKELTKRIRSLCTTVIPRM